MKIIIIYHSLYGHTKIVAEHIQKGASSQLEQVILLSTLSLFASQHSMLWISTGILPKFKNDRQLEEPNGLASYLGLMALSDNSTKEVNLPKGLETAGLFGQRIAKITTKFKRSK